VARDGQTLKEKTCPDLRAKKSVIRSELMGWKEKG
jgi:hypothetical protein